MPYYQEFYKIYRYSSGNTVFKVSGEKVGACELGSGNYVNALAVDGEKKGVVFAGGKDGILVKIQF